VFFVTISIQTESEKSGWKWITIEIDSKEKLEELKIEISKSENKKIIMIRNVSEI
jgi:hypothetical protein